MNQEQKEWLDSIAAAAQRAKHIFPSMAACEAALESNYGESKLAREANNLFGMKAHRHNVYGVEKLPTREFEKGEWITISAEWEKYETIEQCFSDRMETLRRLQDIYPNYRAAILAKSPEDYTFAVSKTWSTDPNRAHKVLGIYKELIEWPQ